MPPWSRSLTNLKSVLASLYPTIPDSRRVVDDAGIPSAQIAFYPKAALNWHAILEEANRRQSVDKIIRVALEDYPEQPLLQEALAGGLNLVEGWSLDADEHLLKEPDDTWATYEVITGKTSTLLPISFLEVGVKRSRSVARVVLPNGTGSGFLLGGNNLFVTNYHVLQSPTVADAATLQFNFQKTTMGLDAEPAELKLDPSSFFRTSKEDDWTVCRVRGDANADWGSVPVESAAIATKDPVFIIQHPGGGPKQIALYRNMVTVVGPKRIQYLTDTMPGSSGSPVFDREWRLVAIHHAGGGRVSKTSTLVYRNHGIFAEVLLDALAGDL